MSAPVVPGAHRHPDRVGIPPWLLASLTVALGVASGIAGQSVARGRLTPELGFAAGFGVAALAMVGLPSISVRLISRTFLFVSALTLVRFGSLSGSITSGGQRLLAWLIAGVCVLVLADRVGTEAEAPLGGDAPTGGTASPWGTARTTVVAAGIVALVAVLLAPILLPYVGQPTEAGRGANVDPTQGLTSSLRSSDSLDMTSRPNLTDSVVFTVETDRATFWRGQTFDLWDGRRWSRSDDSFAPLIDDSVPRLADDDLGATGSDVVRQRFRIEADYTDIVYAAPTAVEVDIDRAVRQRRDGTLLSAPLGRGATYTVVSRRAPITAERLRAVDGGTVPDAVAEQYAQPPETTRRVRDAATEITAGAPTQYDEILAIQAWMGARVEYSLDAPLAPTDVDVVDHFLFDAEQGWCEQIASSLVVLARANGIPARLVSGFVPGDRDPVTGVFKVRERDAHAWAEVWFPEVGWVPFDPTANVPFAGADKSEPTALQWLLDHAVLIGLALAAVVLFVGPLRALAKRLWARRPDRTPGWAAGADRRLAALGRRIDRPRREDETATAYGGVLAERYRDPGLAGAGRLIDDALYSSTPPTPAELASADAALGRAEQAPAPSPDPDPEPVRSG